VSTSTHFILKKCACLLTTTNRDFDDHGPAGPTAFWKLNDDHLEDESTAPERLPMPYVWEWTGDDEDSDDEDEDEAWVGQETTT